MRQPVPAVPNRAVRFMPLLAQQDGGSGLLEFALAASLLFTMIFGIMDCSRLVYVDHFLAGAARDATRYAMVRGSSWSSACTSTTSANCTASANNITAYVQSMTAPAVTSSALSVSSSWPGVNADGSGCTGSGGSSNDPGCLVLVKITYTYTLSLPFLPHLVVPLSSTSEVTIEE